MRTVRIIGGVIVCFVCLLTLNNFLTSTKEIKLSSPTLTLSIGESKDLLVSLPDNVTQVMWESSNHKIVTVTDGKVTAHRSGTAMVTVIAGDESTTCNITVTKARPQKSVTVQKQETNISLQKPSLLLVGETVRLQGAGVPMNATTKSIVWSSSNKHVATVSNGRVTARNAGKTVITAVANHKKTSTTVTVKKMKVITKPEQLIFLLEDAIRQRKDSVTCMIQDYDPNQYFYNLNTELGTNHMSANYQTDTETNISTVKYDLKKAYLGDVASEAIAYAYQIKDITSLSEKELQVYNEASQVIKKYIKPSMTDYEKERIIHDYIVLNTAYDTRAKNDIPDDSYSPYGVLFKGVAVCEGYAKTMAMFLDMLTIENKYIVGTANGGGHSWNLVKINGKYYQLDVTWDDPSPDQENIIRHAYFNVTDKQLNNHAWNKTKAPVATATDDNFFVKNNLTISSYPELQRKVIAAIKNKENAIELIGKNGYDITTANLKFIFNTKTKGYSYSILGETIRIVPKY